MLEEKKNQADKSLDKDELNKVTGGVAMTETQLDGDASADENDSKKVSGGARYRF